MIKLTDDCCILILQCLTIGQSYRICTTSNQFYSAFLYQLKQSDQLIVKWHRSHNNLKQLIHIDGIDSNQKLCHIITDELSRKFATLPTASYVDHERGFRYDLSMEYFLHNRKPLIRLIVSSAWGLSKSFIYPMDEIVECNHIVDDCESNANIVAFDKFCINFHQSGLDRFNIFPSITKPKNQSMESSMIEKINPFTDPIYKTTFKRRPGFRQLVESTKCQCYSSDHKLIWEKRIQDVINDSDTLNQLIQDEPDAFFDIHSFTFVPNESCNMLLFIESVVFSYDVKSDPWRIIIIDFDKNRFGVIKNDSDFRLDYCTSSDDDDNDDSVPIHDLKNDSSSMIQFVPISQMIQPEEKIDFCCSVDDDTLILANKQKVWRIYWSSETKMYNIRILDQSFNHADPFVFCAGTQKLIKFHPILPHVQHINSPLSCLNHKE